MYHAPYVFFDAIIDLVGDKKSTVLDQETHYHPEELEIAVLDGEWQSSMDEVDDFSMES